MRHRRSSTQRFWVQGRVTRGTLLPLRHLSVCSCVPSSVCHVHACVCAAVSFFLLKLLARQECEA